MGNIQARLQIAVSEFQPIMLTLSAISISRFIMAIKSTTLFTRRAETRGTPGQSVNDDFSRQLQSDFNHDSKCCNIQETIAPNISCAVKTFAPMYLINVKSDGSRMLSSAVLASPFHFPTWTLLT